MAETRRPVFVISGVSAGLGEALCHLLLEQGKTVVCIGRNFTSEQKASTGARLIACDLSSSENLEQLSLDAALTGHDEVIFLSNAGVIEPVGLAGEPDFAAVTSSLHVNALAPPAIAAAILRAAAQAKLTFVNISSGATSRAVAGWSAYCAGKAAASAYFDCVALERPDIRVIHRDPGVMNTGMQTAIRSHNTSQFPRHEEFMRFKSDKKLRDPRSVAAEILEEVGV